MTFSDVDEWTQDTVSCGSLHHDPWGAPTGADTVIWRYWVQNTGSTITINSNTLSSDAATINTDIWRAWVTASRDLTITTNHVLQQRLPLDTAEQMAARRAEEAQFRERRLADEARWLEAEKKKKEAEQRAENLLRSHLSKDEQKSLDSKGFFLVKSLKGNLYRVEQGSHGNLYLLDPVSLEKIEQLCVQPSNVPMKDINLTQKLWLEADEDGLRKIANITLLDPRRAA